MEEINPADLRQPLTTPFPILLTGLNFASNTFCGELLGPPYLLAKLYPVNSKQYTDGLVEN